jgi:molecular chaperone DnaK (HSP70)
MRVDVAVRLDSTVILTKVMFKRFLKKRPSVVILDNDAPIGKSGVLSETFGVRIHDGSLAPFAPQGEHYPFEGSFTFSTSQDNQDQITLCFFRGTDRAAVNCKFLGEVRLRGFNLLPAQQPLVRLYFRLADNKIALWAYDEKDGNQIQISIVRNREGVSIH